MPNTLTFIFVEEGDEQDVAYINGEYTVGEYYFSTEAIEWTAKKIDPDIEIKYYSISREIAEDLNGFPTHLPNNFIENWNAVEQFHNV